ncbi:MAG TPA: formyltetrahydrofolate deformylase [Candidatus Nanopelagicales bacterium]|nr:formyltetrahydrofolate deformylase [Candidatus Nanopelagicales bacterium]
MSTERYVMTLRCVDTSGVIHAVSGALVGIGGNVLEQAQFTNESTGVFAMRTRFECPDNDVAAVRASLEQATNQFDPQLSVRREGDRPRVLIMVSQYDHCLVDLLYRQNAGEIAMDVPVIVSNHRVCEPIAEQYGIPFRHIPVEKGKKEEAEDRLREVMAEFDVDAVVLARYMQILSDRLCHDLQGRAINIHHSFLPGFKGARPYHQAYDRGVKLIGATAHFVTADLDEGPIIEQGVERVEHHHTAEEMARIGRDIERLVLARAVTLFAEDRVLLEGHRTVVFS